MDFFDIDFSKVKVENSFEALPVGSYNVISDEAEHKPTKAGDGAYISIKFKILDGNHKDRFLFANFNTANKNQKAADIGISQLKGFISAANIKQDNFKSAVELVGYKAQAVVKHKVDSYGTKAVISYFKPMTVESITASTQSKGADGLF